MLRSGHPRGGRVAARTPECRPRQMGPAPRELDALERSCLGGFLRPVPLVGVRGLFAPALLVVRPALTGFVPQPSVGSSVLTRASQPACSAKARVCQWLRCAHLLHDNQGGEHEEAQRRSRRLCCYYVLRHGTFAAQPDSPGCFGRDRAAYATVNGSAGAGAPGVGYYASTLAQVTTVRSTRTTSTSTGANISPGQIEL